MLAAQIGVRPRARSVCDTIYHTRTFSCLLRLLNLQPPMFPCLYDVMTPTFPRAHAHMLVTYLFWRYCDPSLASFPRPFRLLVTQPLSCRLSNIYYTAP